MCAMCACPTRLALDNDQLVCSPCKRHAAVGATLAPTRPADFWTHPIMQAARASRNIGAVCLAYRSHPASRAAHAGSVSQASVAAWVGISQAQVCRIERGTNVVRDLAKLRRWAQALRMPASFSWFEIPDESDVSAPHDGSCSFGDQGVTEEDDVKRRTLLVGAASAAATGQPWERLSPALDATSRLADVDVDQLEHATANYCRREEVEPARRLMRGLRHHIEALNRLLNGAPPLHLRNRLLCTIGEALALYGWFSFDRNEWAA